MAMPTQAAARPTVQAAVAQAAAQVLGLAEVDLRADFFALGGSSLAVALLTEQLEGALGVPCPIQLLYEHPVLADFANAVQMLLPDGQERHA